MSQLTHNRHTVSLASVFQPVLNSLVRLTKMVRCGQDAGGELDEMQVLLETLPLSIDDFATACNRLRNAQRYLQARERGAARWELNTLRQQLGNRLEAEAKPGRRRRGK